MTNKLSKEAFAKAAKFVREEARPVDKAFFELFFGTGSAEAVVEALKPFQNDDGGFGNFLEPDFRLQESSVMVTTVAFKFLIEAGVSGEEELVRRGVDYLVKQEKNLSWLPVPKAIDEVPRAPWWQYENWAHREGASWLNPNAEVVSILVFYKNLVPQELVEKSVKKVEKVLANLPEKIEMHDFLATLPLAERAQGELRSFVFQKLADKVKSTVAFDAKDWSTYGLKPYWVAEKPDSPLVSELGDALEQSLDFEIEQQGADGAWAPNWAWGQFEEDWEKARKEWKGWLTVKVLRSLDAFGKTSPA